MLTELTLRKLLPRAGKRIEVWDEKIPGFGIRVSESGTKSFVLMYRKDGRQQRLTLGRYPIVTLAEARALAIDALNKVTHGHEPSPTRAALNTSPRFDEAVEDFIATYASQYYRASHKHEMSRLLRSRFVSAWGNRRIDEISRADVIRLIDDVAKGGAPSAANHSLAAIRKVFTWCVDRGLIESNPAAAIKRPAPVASRDRVLDEREIAAVWTTASSMSPPFGPIVRLLLLTAQRRGEVCGMMWSELDFEKRLWTLPAQRTKSNRVQVVPLSRLTVSMFETIPNLHESVVFPARGNERSTPSGFSKMKGRLDAQSGVNAWTLHDLRRTAATHMARLGVAPHVIERILNHTTGILGGVAGIYNRFEYLPAMTDALELWAEV